MERELMLTGIGGQGVQLAAQVIARAATLEGRSVMFFGVYGGTTPTPRSDKFANEGIRFNSYYVQAQCTPTRSAIMTGRQSVRSGTFKVTCDAP